jgi:hypothetical protein
MTKRGEELERAKSRLKALVDAVLDVKGNAEASRILQDALEGAVGAIVDIEELQVTATTALAHAYAMATLEKVNEPQLRLVAP